MEWLQTTPQASQWSPLQLRKMLCKTVVTVKLGSMQLCFFKLFPFLAFDCTFERSCNISHFSALVSIPLQSLCTPCQWDMSLVKFVKQSRQSIRNDLDSNLCWRVQKMLGIKLSASKMHETSINLSCISTNFNHRRFQFHLMWSSCINSEGIQHNVCECILT